MLYKPGDIIKVDYATGSRIYKVERIMNDRGAYKFEVLWTTYTDNYQKGYKDIWTIGGDFCKSYKLDKLELLLYL